ncbi:uncharacterized protein [Physcomitrium patens]|uniref:uncharacterized protein isoform X2 n=1 Tax=Physcomitrium patens TaxID=3218 RepID=UPI003CCDDDA8
MPEETSSAEGDSAVGTPRPGLSETHADSMGSAQFMLQKELREKFQAHDDRYAAQIGSLEGQTEFQSVSLDNLRQIQHKSLCTQIDELRNHVGVLFFRSC